MFDLTEYKNAFWKEKDEVMRATTGFKQMKLNTGPS